MNAFEFIGFLVSIIWFFGISILVLANLFSNSDLETKVDQLKNEIDRLTARESSKHL